MDLGDNVSFCFSLIVNSSGRKAITLFGGGVGLGSSWTRVNMELEDILK